MNITDLSPAALKAAQSVMDREERAEARRKAREEETRIANEKRAEIEARVRPSGMSDAVWSLVASRAWDTAHGCGWNEYEDELGDLVDFLDEVEDAS